MNIRTLTQRMSSNAQTIKSLSVHVDEQQARWRPDPTAWSILEVIHHLYDEEKEDFRIRLAIILNQDQEPWPPIDPAGWVKSRAYNEQNLSRVLAGFLQEREKSIGWLHTLDKPNWTAAYQAPWGMICAGDMFASWVAHDLLHIRQLIELHWAYTQSLVSPYSTQYAGDW